ncbi:hypothetical protein E4U30_004579 [Claviceps sp. LM220 group G6]|nr:hypothetical protein E4U30_004579 [Claviceps sp. LM220 group G6]
MSGNCIKRSKTSIRRDGSAVPRSFSFGLRQRFSTLDMTASNMRTEDPRTIPIRPKRPIADVQSPQTERTPSRHSAGPPHAESVAIRPRPRTPTRPAIKSAFLTRDDSGLQFHRPGPPSSQGPARNECQRIQRLHRSVRRDSDAQPPSLTPTASEIYARDNQFTASPTLRQSGGPDLDDVFAPTSTQPRESIAPSARSSQYHSATVSDESEAETDIFTPPVESINVSQTTHALVNHPPDMPNPGLPLDAVQVAGELDVPCPHIAASCRRYSCSLNLIPKFGFSNYWYRLEWQARGSPHIHGLFWMKGAPTINPELRGLAEQANTHGFLTFWGPHITAINPHTRDMGAIVNRVQRHACSPYCQRR